MLFRARMKLKKKQSQAALLILGSLTGIAWSTCESLAEDPSKLEENGAFDQLMDLSTPDFDTIDRQNSQKHSKDMFTKRIVSIRRHDVRIRLSTKRIQQHKTALPERSGDECSCAAQGCQRSNRR